MEKKSLIIITGLVIILIVGIVLINYFTNEYVDIEDIKFCEKNSDCIKVNAGCCGCTAGGNAITINRTYENYWNNKLEEDCKKIDCVAVMSNHWTCSEFTEPKCVNNKCELIEKQI